MPKTTITQGFQDTIYKPEEASFANRGTLNKRHTNGGEPSSCRDKLEQKCAQTKVVLLLKQFLVIQSWHSGEIQKLTHFEENKPIETSSHCDDKEHIGQITSIVHQEFHNCLQFKKNYNC